jgi:hypothetical protein
MMHCNMGDAHVRVVEAPSRIHFDGQTEAYVDFVGLRLERLD